MKNLNIRIKAILFVLLCVPFCGAWTVAAEEPETRYTGGELISTYATETISYVSKEIEEITTANNAPSYHSIDDMTNGCGAVAGATVVGFYDKYYNNLITGWDSYYSTGRYKAQEYTYVSALLKDLYARMKTNQVQPGVSENDFKDGLKSYINSKGYNINYSSLGKGNGFDYNAFKSAIKNNEVTALFVQPSNIYLLSYSSSGNKDTVASSTISGNHIMVAYGYYEVKYTLTNGTRTDKYLMVSTGYVTGLALYKVGSYIDAAYVVKIS